MYSTMGNFGLEEQQYLNILKNNGIIDEVSNVDIVIPENLIGEHFGSLCEHVTIQFKNKAEECNFFVKKMLPLPDPIQAKRFQGIMLKEGFFLTKLIQDLKNLCLQKTG